jgi:hypothetical protein
MNYHELSALQVYLALKVGYNWLEELIRASVVNFWDG